MVGHWDTWLEPSRADVKEVTRRYLSIFRKCSWNAAKVWASGSKRHQLRQASVKRPVAAMIFYPMRATAVSTSGSCAAFAKYAPSSSCWKSMSMGVGGCKAAVIRRAFSSFISIVTFPYSVRWRVSICRHVTCQNPDRRSFNAFR